MAAGVAVFEWTSKDKTTVAKTHGIDFSWCLPFDGHATDNENICIIVLSCDVSPNNKSINALVHSLSLTSS